MPIITANILAGRPWTARKALIKGLTDATVEALGVDPSAVRVLLTEVPPEHWGAGGVPKGTPAGEDA